MEKLTCTDLEQAWGGMKDAKLSQFEPVPLEKFCHLGKQQTPYRRMVLDVTQEMAEEFRALFLEGTLIK